MTDKTSARDAYNAALDAAYRAYSDAMFASHTVCDADRDAIEAAARSALDAALDAAYRAYSDAISASRAAAISAAIDDALQEMGMRKDNE